MSHDFAGLSDISALGVKFKFKLQTVRGKWWVGDVRIQSSFQHEPNPA